MNSNVEEVDGVLYLSPSAMYVSTIPCRALLPLLTKYTHYPEPNEEWTNNYQDMGGDEYWGEGGKVVEVLKSRGLHGDVKPLFALDAESGKPYTLFELDGTFYFFDAGDDSLQRITYPQELGVILGTITDPDGGLDDISTSNV